jgi:hypothetical protein
MYRQASDPALKAKLRAEMKYGVKGALYRQEADGRWRQGFANRTYWTGTTASLAAGLAATLPVWKETDPTLAKQVEKAMALAWNAVAQKREDRTSWAVGGEGKLPDGTVLKSDLPAQRNLWREAYLLLAVNMYFAIGDSNYWNAAEAEISNGTLSTYGGWVKIGTDSFPGQSASSHGNWALRALLRFYPQASAANKTHIEEIADAYYARFIVPPGSVGGPFGFYEKMMRANHTANAWVIPDRLHSAMLLYDLFGKKYGKGMLLARRTTDWFFGKNPMDTSLLFGIGDRHILVGWASYHAIGRHMGLEPQIVDPSYLMGTQSDYGASETTVESTLSLWNALILLNKHRSELYGATLFEGEKGQGARLTLPPGNYPASQLHAYGIHDKAIRSIQLPEGCLVTLFSGENLDGDSMQYAVSQPHLGSFDRRACSLKITLPDPVPPQKPIHPRPSNNAPQQNTQLTLRWENGGAAYFYDLYLNGTCLATNLSETSFLLKHLACATSYVWRVDAVNPYGRIQGEEWSFSTKKTPEEKALISVFATATQSTELWGGAFPAQNGLDGDRQNFTHTDTTSLNNYWQLRLDANYEISRISILNRPYSFGKRLNHCVVHIFDQNMKSIWKSAPISGATDGSIHNIKVPPGKVGCVIRIGLENEETNGEGGREVSVGEVKVYGLPVQI